jgi:hypothetical protein
MDSKKKDREGRRTEGKRQDRRQRKSGKRRIKTGSKSEWRGEKDWRVKEWRRVEEGWGWVGVGSIKGDAGKKGKWRKWKIDEGRLGGGGGGKSGGRVPIWEKTTGRVKLDEVGRLERELAIRRG